MFIAANLFHFRLRSEERTRRGTQVERLSRLPNEAVHNGVLAL